MPSRKSFTAPIPAAMQVALLLAAMACVAACTLMPARAHAASESYALLADTHLGLPGQRVYDEIEDALYWASELKGLKAVAVAGDLTDRGDEVAYSEWEFLYDSIVGSRAKRIVALGDHDTGKYGAYLKVDRTLTVANGYRNFLLANGGALTTFRQFKHANIMTLGGIRASGHAVITDAMLKLLNARLLKTARQGKLAIVVCHYPISSGVLNKRARLMGILRSYPNVIYVSGHTHLYSASAQCRSASPSCATTPYARIGFDRKRKFAIRCIGVNTTSAYRGRGTSYADSMTVTDSGIVLLKKWNLGKGSVMRNWAFKQAKSSITVKSACSSKRYPKSARITYKVNFSDGKTYGNVKSGATFTLKVGQRKTFGNIPAGVLVKVKAIKVPKGWKKGSARYAEVAKTPRALTVTSSYVRSGASSGALVAA